MDARKPFEIRRYPIRSALAMKMEKYLTWRLEHDFSEYGVKAVWHQLGYFLQWCSERGIETPEDVSREILERYQRQLYRQKNLKKNNGEPLSNTTRRDRLFVVKGFFHYLVKTRQLVYSPAADLEIPKEGVRLPRNVLTVSEVEQILNNISLSGIMAIRDRAIIEVLYSTGLRRMELCNLKLNDVDMSRGWLMVIQGKGRKDRVVPIGERALVWLEKYLWEQRPRLLREAGEEHLFLTRQGKPLRAEGLTLVLDKHVKRGKTGKSGSCHIFRHTMATLMLENGADVRFIQEMLGHNKLETTQLYTRVAISKLKEVHEKTHPGAHLKPKAKEPLKQGLFLLPERSEPEEERA